MLSLTVFTTLSLAWCTMAAPLQLESRDMGKYTNDIEIHSSCNATERRQLLRALSETYELAQVAVDYITANGPEDPVYQTYFGKGSYVEAIGAYEALLHSNKAGVLLRCDDIDGNCHQDGWAGHWRGENATSETVICPLSYEIRKPLEQFCAFGYEVASHSASYYFATDMMHRLYHVPAIANDLVGHFADDYEDCLELAIHNATYAPINTHTLQYFAADVYAREVGNPGEGCTGHHDHPDQAPASSTASVAAAATVAASVTRDAPVTATSTSSGSCHTHANGDVHC